MNQSPECAKAALFPRMTAALLAVILALTICTPFAYAAAAPAKYSDLTTNDQRVQYFQDTYGFDKVGKIETVVNGKWVSDSIGTTNILSIAQNGFSLVGSSTVKKIIAEYDNVFLILNPAEAGVPVGNFGGGVLSLKETADVFAVIHETMHAFNGVLSTEGLLKMSGSETMAKINGGYSGFTNTNQYVGAYAATDSSEDFAETAATMILSGGDTPCALGKDTILYKKYVACYDLLLENFGAKSNAVIRSAAFLGIELPKE